MVPESGTLLIGTGAGDRRRVGSTVTVETAVWALAADTSAIASRAKSAYFLIFQVISSGLSLPDPRIYKRSMIYAKTRDLTDEYRASHFS